MSISVSAGHYIADGTCDFFNFDNASGGSQSDPQQGFQVGTAALSAGRARYTSTTSVARYGGSALIGAPRSQGGYAYVPEGFGNLAVNGGFVLRHAGRITERCRITGADEEGVSTLHLTVVKVAELK